jgi:hypothetical protein
VFVPFIGVDESAGLSGDGSTIWGAAAGVSGEEVGLGAGLAAATSCGNVCSAFGESLRTTVFDLLVLVDIFAIATGGDVMVAMRGGDVDGWQRAVLVCRRRGFVF